MAFAIEIDLTAKDTSGPAFESAAKHAESFAARIKRLNREDRASGQSALESSFKQGGPLGVLLAGTGLGLAEIGADQFGEVAKKLGETFVEMSKGAMTAGQAATGLADSFIASLPGIGSVYTGVRGLIEGYGDYSASVARAEGADESFVRSLQSDAKQLEEYKSTIAALAESHRELAKAQSAAAEGRLSGADAERRKENDSFAADREAAAEAFGKRIEATPGTDKKAEVEREYLQQRIAAQEAFDLRIAAINRRDDLEEENTERDHYRRMADIAAKGKIAVLASQHLDQESKLAEINRQAETDKEATRRRADTEIAKLPVENPADINTRADREIDRAKKGSRDRRTALMAEREKIQNEIDSKEIFDYHDDSVHRQQQGERRQKISDIDKRLGVPDSELVKAVSDTNKDRAEALAAAKKNADHRLKIERDATAESIEIERTRQEQVAAAQSDFDQNRRHEMADSARDLAEAQGDADSALLQAQGHALESQLALLRTNHEARIATIRDAARKEIDALPHDKDYDERRKTIEKTASGKVVSELQQQSTDTTQAQLDFADKQAEAQQRINDITATGKRIDADRGDASAKAWLAQQQVVSDYAAKRRELVKIAADLNQSAEVRKAAETALVGLAQDQVKAAAEAARQSAQAAAHESLGAQDELASQHIADLRIEESLGNRAAGIEAKRLEIAEQFAHRRQEILDILQRESLTAAQRTDAEKELGDLSARQAQAEYAERRKAIGEWRAEIRETALATNVNAGYLTGVAQMFQAQADMAAAAQGYQTRFTATVGGGNAGTGVAPAFVAHNPPAIQLSGFAAGGPVESGKTIIVGEKGPELFVPPSDGKIVPNHQIQADAAIAQSKPQPFSSVYIPQAAPPAPPTVARESAKPSPVTSARPTQAPHHQSRAEWRNNEYAGASSPHAATIAQHAQDAPGAAQVVAEGQHRTDESHAAALARVNEGVKRGSESHTQAMIRAAGGDSPPSAAEPSEFPRADSLDPRASFSGPRDGVALPATPLPYEAMPAQNTRAAQVAAGRMPPIQRQRPIAAATPAAGANSPQSRQPPDAKASGSPAVAGGSDPVLKQILDAIIALGKMEIVVEAHLD